MKNYSLLRGSDGLQHLSPAYDQLCTRLVIENDDLALPVGGKKANLTRRTWLEYAEYCGIPEKAATRVLTGLVDATGDALSLISRSFLSEEMRERYRRNVSEPSAVLKGRKAR